MSISTRQVLLKSRPDGPTDADTWDYVITELAPPADGELLVKVDFISMDPAMRGWLNDVRSYIPPVEIGAVMRAYGVGTVVESRHPDFQPGDAVTGKFGASEFAVIDGVGVTKVDLSAAPGPTWLGTLGIAGLTAYFGLLDVGRLSSGDVVLVSGAAGAVGSAAGQMAKAKGATVIGIAGGRDKCDWLINTLGFDAVIDYKSESVGDRLRELAPDGIDIYFDNVGGPILDDALANLALGARIVICGAISTYNDSELLPGPSRYMSLLVFRASMTGLLVLDYEDRFPEAIEQIAAWLTDGTLVARETVVTGGIDRFGEALTMLFDGRNTGKLVLKV